MLGKAGTMSPMTFGSGEYCYQCVEGWGQPEGREEILFHQVAGLASDAEDHIYVLTRTEIPIYVLDKEGNILDTFGQGIFGRAHGLHRSADGCIWGVDDMRHAVYRFSPEHRLTLTLGTPDVPSDTGYLGRDAAQNTVLRAAGPFNRPTRMTSDAEGNLYISDGYGNARIHISQNIQINVIIRMIDLKDILSSHLAAGGIFDYSHRAVKLI